MIINFSKNYQFNTRLKLEGKLIQQIKQTKLLGVIVDDNLSWQSNTNHACLQKNGNFTTLVQFLSALRRLDRHLQTIYTISS